MSLKVSARSLKTPRKIDESSGIQVPCHTNIALRYLRDYAYPALPAKRANYLCTDVPTLQGCIVECVGSGDLNR